MMITTNNEKPSFIFCKSCIGGNMAKI